VLVLHGDPGVGQSALMDCLAKQASGCRLLRAAGAASEMEVAYAALQQVCAPMLDHLDHLPAPQGDALGTAFGLSAGPAPWFQCWNGVGGRRRHIVSRANRDRLCGRKQGTAGIVSGRSRRDTREYLITVWELARLCERLWRSGRFVVHIRCDG
jgi:hypothetical protein